MQQLKSYCNKCGGRFMPREMSGYIGKCKQCARSFIKTNKKKKLLGTLDAAALQEKKNILVVLRDREIKHDNFYASIKIKNEQKRYIASWAGVRRQIKNVKISLRTYSSSCPEWCEEAFALVQLAHVAYTNRKTVEERPETIQTWYDLLSDELKDKVNELNESWRGLRSSPLRRKVNVEKICNK